MATLKKHASQMADADGSPLIGQRQAAITAAVVAHSITDTAADLSAANELELEGFYNALGVAINSIITVLEAHGLVETND